MGKIKKGILGGFSGKVGNVVGASWNGISYMRSLPQKVKNPRTQGQRSQRSKFAMVLHLLKPLTAFLRTGWKLYAKGQSPFNAATSYTLANAITGTYPNYQIDLSKLLVSRGSLSPAANGKAETTADKLVISWNDNSGTDSANTTDKALVAVLNPAKGETITITAGEKRTAGEQTIPMPEDWSGDEVHTYLGFVSEDGREIANSVYLGKTNIA
jgi:hypothetical protein